MEFDINVYRSFITVLALVLFVGLMVWTWRKGRNGAFDEVAQMPLVEDPVSSDKQ